MDRPAGPPPNENRDQRMKQLIQPIAISAYQADLIEALSFAAG